MKKLLIILMLFLLSGCVPNSDNNVYFNDNKLLIIDENSLNLETTYYLDVTLDNDDKALDVVGRIYYNVLEDTNTLYVRLYPNASYIDTLQDSVDLEYFKINGVVVDNLDFSSHDRTLLVIELETSANEGDILEIDFSYQFNYWIGEGRISYYTDNTYDYYITMFFYPFVQLNNVEDDTYDYAFGGESYYNSIGDYHVSVDVPHDFDIVSSGKEVDSVKKNNRLQTYFYLDDGRDFSFSTSDSYHFYSREINGVEFRIFSIEDLNNSVVNENFDILEHSFNTYTEYIGEYPYDYFNLELGNIYGMESTGVIYCSSNISEGTIVHEVVHQWIYSIIHNDQGSEPFLDEALTTYISFLYYYERYSMDAANEYLDYRSSFKEGLEQHYIDYEGYSLLLNIHEYHTSYAYTIYYHGPTIYRYYFDNIVGNNTTKVKEFLNALFDEYKYQELSIDELLDLLEETTGIEGTKDWFYEEMLSLGQIEPLS